MIKKTLILFDKIGPKAKFLGRELNADVARFTDLLFDIDGQRLKILVEETDITKYKLVYIRRADHSHFSLAGSLALCLDKLGIQYFDRSLSEIGAAGDKLTSYMRLSMAGLPVPQTIFCMGVNVKKFEDFIIDKIGFPIVAKELVSQHTKGIFVLREKKDFDELPKQYDNRIPKYLFQKYIPILKEYRILVLGDKAVSAQQMFRDLGNFKAKVDMNADWRFEDIKDVSKEVRELAVNAAKTVNIQIAGVDIAISKDTGKRLIFEVNRGPGFTYDTKISPEIPELAKFVGEKIKN